MSTVNKTGRKTFTSSNMHPQSPRMKKYAPTVNKTETLSLPKTCVNSENSWKTFTFSNKEKESERAVLIDHWPFPV